MSIKINEKSKKLKRILSTAVIAISYIAGMYQVGSAVGQYTDEIKSFYHGSYICEDTDNHWLKITNGTTTYFKGYYLGKGTVSCSNMNTTMIYFDPDSKNNGENFSFVYESWAKVVNGDYFTPQTGTITITGNSFNLKDTDRIIVISSKNYIDN